MLFFFFFLLIRPPPSSTLFPYTTLFRSLRGTFGRFTDLIVEHIPLHLLAIIYGIDSAQPQGMISVQQRSEEHTSELQSRLHLVCRLLLEKKKKITNV